MRFSNIKNFVSRQRTVPVLLGAVLWMAVAGPAARAQALPVPPRSQQSSPATGATPMSSPPQAAQPAPPQPTAVAPPLAPFSLQNADLVSVIEQLARLAKINYVLDPRVKGSVTLNTYGENKNVNPREMLDAILHMNGFTMVQTGDLYHIMPMVDIARMALRPESLEKDIPDDERPMMNLIFLKYASVDELSKLATEFLGADGKVWTYPAANLLLVMDTRRNMRRLMELIAMFDSDTLAKQRVKVFDVVNSRPSDIAKELENVLKSISLSKESNNVKFVPVNRINALIAVAPNPGIFVLVEEWLRKLDVKVKSAAGKSDTYVYRVKYAQAEQLAMSITNLYYSMMGGMGGGYGMGYGGGGYGMGGYGMGGYGMGGNSMGGYGMGGYGGMSGGGMYGGGMYGGGAYGGMSGGSYGATTGSALPGFSSVSPSGTSSQSSLGSGLSSSSTVSGISTSPGNLTGSYLGSGGYGMGGYGMTPGSTEYGPRVMANGSDNSLLILATPEQHESVVKLLEQLDVPPRQVLIEAQILEVTLTGAFSSGVSAWLQQRGATNPATVPGSTSSSGRQLIGAFDGTLTTLSAGMLVGQSRQLFGLLTAQETSGRTKVVSNPKIIATDSIPAYINVGDQVPTLTSQALTGAQSSGSSLFASTVANVTTGTTLNLTARVNPSGVVTLLIDQEVSSPVPAVAGAAIQSPSFSQRTIKTQVTVQDGDMIAIGGIISETKTDSTSGIPILNKIPFIGQAFGSKSTTKLRTELVVFLTPHVIYDTNGVSEASDELVEGMKRVQKLIR
jgi:general secretion pathway protein D